MSTEPRHAEIGDPLPNIILPDASGSGVGLSQPQRAGRWQVLVFASTDTITDGQDALRDFNSRLNKIEGVLLSIALISPTDTIPADLFDESAKAAAFLLGPANEGVAIISPEGRLAKQMGLDDLEQAVAYCEKGFNAQTVVTLETFAPALMVDQVLSADLCEKIIEFWKNAPRKGDPANGIPAGDPRKHSDVALDSKELFDEVKMGIGRRVLPLVERAFRMKIASLETPRIRCFTTDPESNLIWHRDNTTAFTAHRRFTVMLNLNAGDYEGGETRFPEYGRTLYQASRGSVIVSSCSLLQQALPVTSGERFALFTFLTDAAGLEEEKAMVERMKAKKL